MVGRWHVDGRHHICRGHAAGCYGLDCQKRFGGELVLVGVRDWRNVHGFRVRQDVATSRSDDGCGADQAPLQWQSSQWLALLAFVLRCDDRKPIHYRLGHPCDVDDPRTNSFL